MSPEHQKELENIVEGLTDGEKVAFSSGVLVGTVEVIEDLYFVAKTGSIEQVREALDEYVQAILNLKNQMSGEGK